MRKIAAMAVALGLFVAGASTNMASAHATQHSNNETSSTQMQTVAYEEAQTPQAVDPAPAEPADTVYSVVSGDTLSGIADSYSTTYMRLYDANDFINDPDLIYPGDQIRVPGQDEQVATRTEAVPVEQTTYTAADDTAVTDTTTAATVDDTAYVAPATNTDVTAGFDPAELNAPVSQPAELQIPYGNPDPYSASDETAKSYIYFHESSFNPDATNYLGCYGLGQDCNNVVRDTCGADWACQDEYFSTYAMQRYGSWQNALAFWEANNWW